MGEEVSDRSKLEGKKGSGLNSGRLRSSWREMGIA